MTGQDQPIETLAEGKFLRLVKQGRWEYAARKGISGIVAIVAVTDDGKLILVEQYRPPVGKPVIELPAGLAGDVEGSELEELSAAARRELLEETGYEADTMEPLGSGSSSAGMCDEMITLFRATGLRKTGLGEGDGQEQITLHEVPVGEVAAWVASKVALGPRRRSEGLRGPLLCDTTGISRGSSGEERSTKPENSNELLKRRKQKSWLSPGSLLSPFAIPSGCVRRIFGLARRVPHVQVPPRNAHGSH